MNKKENVEQRLFEIVSKCEEVISTDLWFDREKHDGENFSLKYIDFQDFDAKFNSQEV